jgi:hypothetical protein
MDRRGECLCRSGHLSHPPPKEVHAIVSNPRAELLRRGALSHKELVTVVLRQGFILHAAHYNTHIPDSCPQLPMLPSTMRRDEREKTPIPGHLRIW